MINRLIEFIRDHYHSDEFIPLHAPTFGGRELEYVKSTIESTFVSSVGSFVDQFEAGIAKYTGSPAAVATTNGTAALHMALNISGVQQGDLVITQPLTFIATCNAISYCGAMPIFVDVDRRSMSLSPTAMEYWLEKNTLLDDAGLCRTKSDHKVVRACLPVHTFGHPADLDNLIDVCKRWNLQLIEDAAESLGSIYKGRHTGTLGDVGILSFNGNKIITTGGGGMILSSEELGQRAKHLTTTAKQPHPYEYIHDSIGFNYRLPNLNAALGCAQLEQIEHFVSAKRSLADKYEAFFRDTEWQFFVEPDNCRSNYWLNTVICENKKQRDLLLKITNEREVMTRPIWMMMNQLTMFEECRKGQLLNAEWLEARVVNLPSSVNAAIP